MTRGGGGWAGRGGVGSGKSEVCHFAIVSYFFSRHQDGLEGKARRKTRQTSGSSKQQQQQDSVKDQRERSDSPLTVAAVRTNQSINQSVNDSIKRHPPESGM